MAMASITKCQFTGKYWENDGSMIISRKIETHIGKNDWTVLGKPLPQSALQQDLDNRSLFNERILDNHAQCWCRTGFEIFFH